MKSKELKLNKFGEEFPIQPYGRNLPNTLPLPSCIVFSLHIFYEIQRTQTR